jgi:lipopolysaccharide transport system ATP-binding protein
MSSDLAVHIDHARKCYRLFESPSDRVKRWIIPPLQRCLGQAPREYGQEFVALDDVYMEIKKGETVGVLGRNGSGKSTLLQLISGTLTPTSGSVSVNGRVAALLELGAGFHPDFTGRENIYLNGALFGLAHGEIEERMEDIIRFADIGPYIDQPVRTYSSGMYVRLAFAVIAHVNADILLIDEALAVGDAFFVQKCMRFLRRFMDRGTLLFVSHDSAAILSLCRKAVLLEQGRIVCTGEAREVCDHYLHRTCERGQNRAEIEARTAFPAPGGNDQPVLAHRDKRKDFGDRKAFIENIALYDAEGRRVRTVTKRERLVLQICCQTSVRLDSPIIGFIVRDRFGQALFGNNTSCLSNGQMPACIEPKTRFVAELEFAMPMLQQGEYCISVALAEGTQQQHVQHHWIHDAIVFESVPSEVCFGSVGVEVLHMAIRQHPIEDSRNDKTAGSLAL